jgi:hypothetical protein
MRDQVSCQVDPTVCSLSQYVKQFVPLAQDARNLPEDVNVLLV